MLGALYDSLKLVLLKILVLYDLGCRFTRPARGTVIRWGTGNQVAFTRKTLCLFAHFDRDGIVDDYVVEYLRSLDEFGCETVFVSTAEQIGENEIGKILPFCRQFIVKQNIGYDFASWRTGLEAAGDISGYERLIVANDSVYGPLQDLRKVCACMEGQDVSFWGITDSLRYGRHLQSYFLVFERPVFESEIFLEFWRNLPDYRNKHVVITRCELGLTHKLASAGFKFAAYCPIENATGGLRRISSSLATKILGNRVNPTHKGWRALVKAGCPFLKIQLLRDNPKKIQDLDAWQAVVGQSSAYDLGLIVRHLARMRAQRSQ